VDDDLLELFRAIASRDEATAGTLLDKTAHLAIAALGTGASRQQSEDFFLTAIRHHVYAGDTALHVAAASFDSDRARQLVGMGADVAARNRRGATPLHYAADGSPGSAHWDPVAQRSVIELLIASGANTSALDMSGVAPLHRAVRTRSAEAVRTLLDDGADVRLRNKQGSTPLHLAVQNTGRSGSGDPAAKDQQRVIITLLLRHGALPTDTDAKGKSVTEAATSDWIRELLHARG
jgi:ankyrin repeat protein